MTSRGNERALRRRQELLDRQRRQLEVLEDYNSAAEEVEVAERRATIEAEIRRLSDELDQARGQLRQVKTKLSPAQARARLAETVADALDAFGTATGAADALGISARDVTRYAAEHRQVQGGATDDGTSRRQGQLPSSAAATVTA